MADKFQGATLVNGATSYDLLSMSVGMTADQIDVTTAADTYKQYEQGAIDGELNFDILGGNPPAIGATGTWVATSAGTAKTIPGVVMSYTIQGSVGDKVVSSIAIKPTGTIS